MSAKYKAAQLIFLLTAGSLFAAAPVDFYATVSSSQDTNMISMTTDLFYTQFQSIDGYTVTDKRTTTYDPATAAPSTISFYAEIQESGDGSWICTLNAIKSSTGKNVSETKKYASYYKILLDAKSSLENLLANLEGRTITDSSSAATSTQGGSVSGSSIESLAGTWTGEPLVDKVLILRGGKGFIIFKNGASMNITVSLSGTSVTIRQAGKSNASFFPELPRDVALQNAATASPIIWNLTLTSADTLVGTKKTLVADTTSDSGVTSGELSVEWKKK
jgi:hypothetical protein